MLQVGDGGIEQLRFGVQAAKLEVVGGHLGVQAQVHAGKVRGAGLGVLTGGLDGAANAAPEVRLPACLAANHQIVVVG